ncbi:hypothetical protein LJC00_01435 [Dysgonomonas sp. OttesenSCG-928-M03]|nr:hypothetical protein [Dysgonomonas sp. OttesenSCG-928-M03]
MKYRFALLYMLFFIGVTNMSAQIFSDNTLTTYDVFHISSNNDTIKRMDVSLKSSNDAWISPREEAIKHYNLITWNLKKQNKIYTDKTGVKETKDEIFLHPIRIDDYAILEFCPFPLVKFPLRIGNKWKWTLENINSHYFDYINKTTNIPKDKVKVVNSYFVEKKSDYYFDEKSKKIECYVIVGVGNSQLGETQLISWFSPVYGFLKMEFKTLNGNVIVFKMKGKKSLNIFNYNNTFH